MVGLLAGGAFLDVAVGVGDMSHVTHDMWSFFSFLFFSLLFFFFFFFMWEFGSLHCIDVSKSKPWSRPVARSEEVLGCCETLQDGDSHTNDTWLGWVLINLIIAPCCTVQCMQLKRSKSEIYPVQNRTEQYDTEQYSTEQYSAVQNSTIQNGAVQYRTVKHKTVQYSTVQCRTVQCSAVQCSTVQCSAVQNSRGSGWWHLLLLWITFPYSWTVTVNPDTWHYRD